MTRGPDRPALTLIQGGRTDRPALPAAIEFARQLARQDIAAMMEGRRSLPRQ